MKEARYALVLVLAVTAGEASGGAGVAERGRVWAKHLLIDDAQIASRENLVRVVHQPERHPANPILMGSEPWEKWVIETDGRSVLYDDQAGEFRMYYVAPLRDATAPTGTRYKTCYAVSRDGIRWTRPELGQVEWEGSRKNNILPWGENWMRRPNVIEDIRDSDPERRYKMTYVDVIGGKTAITKAYSRDGIHWRRNGDGKPWFRESHNSNLLGWDPRVGLYVLYPRMPGTPNSVGRSTSADFVTWSEPTTVLAPQPADGGKDFKGNAAFLYEDLYLGMLWVFDHNRTAEAELVWSRDGVAWQRVTPGKYFFPRGQAGAWDSEMILPVAPVVWKDRIWIYYAGWNMPYNTEALARAHEGLFENGQRKQRAIGLATLRLDGFVSLDAAEEQGVLVTRPLECPGGTLTVNAAIRGDLRVEVLDAAGGPVPGYTAADCAAVKSDSLAHSVRWKGVNKLDGLRGRAVSLRFSLRSGSPYAFWFENS